MNDPKLAAERLSHLAALAQSASTDFDKAAVFAAVQALAAMFNEQEAAFDGYVLEKVELARWHISAAVGYDISNGHGSDQHISWAIGAITTLQDVLEQRGNP